jgi:hypothetical protein
MNAIPVSVGRIRPFFIFRKSRTDVLLKLSGLNSEVRLRGMQFFRGDAKSLLLQDDEQILE